MKKILKFIKDNDRVVLGFIFGVILTSTSVFAAETMFQSTDVSYSNESSGLSSTNVKGALDDLYERANTCIGKTIYRWSTSSWTVNQDISSMVEGTDYLTNPDLLKNIYTQAEIIFLKHIVLDEKVVASYGGIKITQDMANKVSGIKVGTYYLKGGDGGEAYEDNKKILLDAFGNKCTENTNGIVCSDNTSPYYINIEASKTGSIYNHIGDCGSNPFFSCSIATDGKSYCSRRTICVV